MKLVWDRSPDRNNSRNSEGSFLRLKDGRILFAYSRYSSEDSEDSAACDIAAIYSSDEGNSWTEPVVIVNASFFSVKNIMSVSAVNQNDGRVGIYFLVKENDGSSTIGRALSADGITFAPSRCTIAFQKNYYVINNDRIIRLSDGRLAAPAACHGFQASESYAVSVCLISDDDGATFRATPPRLAVSALKERDMGLQEPGIIELTDGTLFMWARTSLGSQYTWQSRDMMQSCTPPSPSLFTSPCSPMELERDPENGDIYAVYNPIPGYLPRSRDYLGVSMGRTPLVMRKSTDDGKTWGGLNTIENEPDRGYCYPSMLFTNDNSILCAYCRGNAHDGICLSRLGIMKIQKSEIV